MMDSASQRGWLVIGFVLGACASQRPWARAELADSSAAPTRTVDINVSRTAFTPDRVRVSVGELVRLRFTRTVASGCAREVVVSLDGERQVRRELPTGVAVDVPLRFDRAGELGFSCGMAMLGGTIDVRPSGNR